MANAVGKKQEDQYIEMLPKLFTIKELPKLNGNDFEITLSINTKLVEVLNKSFAPFVANLSKAYDIRNEKEKYWEEKKARHKEEWKKTLRAQRIKRRELIQKIIDEKMNFQEFLKERDNYPSFSWDSLGLKASTLNRLYRRVRGAHMYQLRKSGNSNVIIADIWNLTNKNASNEIAKYEKNFRFGYIRLSKKGIARTRSGYLLRTRLTSGSLSKALSHS